MTPRVTTFAIKAVIDTHTHPHSPWVQFDIDGRGVLISPDTARDIAAALVRAADHFDPPPEPVAAVAPAPSPEASPAPAVARA